ncbi:MAG: 2-dehydropantoate 2-reductase [Planctomycetota bacterium]|jgi:2-dehydropantoate 2-reductase
MRIAVFGVGGVGGYFGGRLAQHGQDVTFISRNESLKAIKQNGLKVDSIAGDFHVSGIKATDNPREVGPVDYVICAVKSWQIPAAAKAMQPLVGENTLVIPLQNGVEAPAHLSERLDPANILGGLCAIIAFRAAPGHIKHIGANPLIRFAHLDQQADHRINELSEVLNRCNGVKSSIPDDISVAMWQKFMLITPWSGLGSVSRAPIGVLLQQPDTLNLLEAAIEEVYQLGCKLGVDLPQNSVAKILALLQSFPANSTTSMQRDLSNGKPSELDLQNGAVVRLADEAGIETPINRFFLDSLRSLELRARGALSF